MSRITVLEQAVSVPRINRYIAACGGNYNRVNQLYVANIRLSSKLFAVLGMFEITLRNAIDNHYKGQFSVRNGSAEWLQTESSANGFLSSPTLARGGFQSRQNVSLVLTNLGYRYTHDKAVSELSFGFWRYMFAAKEFAAAGSTLLRIFPARPRGVNHTDVYNRLTEINRLRNRIAHHQPICFDRLGAISIATAQTAYGHCLEIFQWLGFDTTVLLNGIDDVTDEFTQISQI
jgi:Abi-like protein